MKTKLKTFYQNGLIGVEPSINMEGLAKAVMQKWISAEDAMEIVGEDNTLDFTKILKLAEISVTCNHIIIAGVDVDTSNGKMHFRLKTEDQANINSLFKVVELGGTEFPYQAQGDSCKVYNAADIMNIYLTSQELITTQTTYHNALKRYVGSLETVEDVSVVQYGMDLPEPFATEVLEKLTVAKTQIETIIATITAKMGG